MCLTRKQLRPLLLVLGVAGLATGVCGGVPADSVPGTKVAEPLPFPDGVIDPERRTAFVSSPLGGIQAIRLGDGKVLWSKDACKGRPWLVAGRRLLARGERLFVLDLKDGGKLLRQCDALAYPKVKVPDRCTVSFHLWSPRVVGDILEARWYGVALIDRSKGRPFAFQAWTTFNKAAPVGTVKINLVTGRAVLQTDPKPANVTAGLIPEEAKPAKRLPPGLPAKLAALWQQYHKDQNGRITLLGERLAGVSMTLERAGQEFLKDVILNAWDVKTAAAAAPVRLVKDKALNIANVVLTEDRCHAGVVFSTSALAIYSLSDGKPVGKGVKGVHSPEKAFVDGKRLYYAQRTGTGAGQAAALKALDLESHKVVWERALKPRNTILLPP